MPKSVWIIFLVVLFDLLGFGIVIPILPYYAETYGATGFTIGMLMMCYSLFQFVAAPFWGRLSDRIGRKPILLISTAGGTIAMLALGFAEAFENPLLALFIARSFAGAFAGNISAAYAYVTDITDESNRAKGMGVVGAALGLGFTLGPVVGGILSHTDNGTDFSLPMFFAAGLGALNLVYCTLKLKESRRPDGKESESLSPALLKRILTLPITGKSIFVYFLFIFAITHLEVIFAIYMGAEFAFTAKDTGYMMGLMGFLMVMVQGGLIGRLVKKHGEQRLTLLASAMAVIGLVAFSFSNTLNLVVVSISVLAISRGVLHPCLSALASKGAPDDLRGLTMGSFHSAASLGRVLGPVTAGLLYDQVSPTGPFLFAAGIMAIASGMAIRWTK